MLTPEGQTDAATVRLYCQQVCQQRCTWLTLLHMRFGGQKTSVENMNSFVQQVVGTRCAASQAVKRNNPVKHSDVYRAAISLLA